MQRREGLPKLRPGGGQRFHDVCKLGYTVNKLPDPLVELRLVHYANWGLFDRDVQTGIMFHAAFLLAVPRNVGAVEVEHDLALAKSVSFPFDSSLKTGWGK